MNKAEFTQKVTELFISYGVEIHNKLNQDILLGTLFVSTFTAHDLSISACISYGGSYNLYIIKVKNRDLNTLFVTQNQSFEKAQTKLNVFMAKYHQLQGYGYRGKTNDA